MSDAFDKAFAAIKNPARREWYAAGAAHGSRFGFCELKAGTEQFEAWRGYFERLGWFPYAFEHVQRGALRSWTAPCQWPADLSFVAPRLPAPSPEPTEGVPF